VGGSVTIPIFLNVPTDGGYQSLLDFYDPNHSDEEERYLIIGVSNQGRLLIASYTERDESTRLISARVVTRAEREAYEEG
jgi:uncharacterized protein